MDKEVEQIMREISNELNKMTDKERDAYFESMGFVFEKDETMEGRES